MRYSAAGWRMFTHFDDRVHRAVEERTRDPVMVFCRDFAVSHQRRVPPVVERKVLGRMLCARAETVTHRAIELDPHAGTTASTSYGRTAPKAPEWHVVQPFSK